MQLRTSAVAAMLFVVSRSSKPPPRAPLPPPPAPPPRRPQSGQMPAATSSTGSVKRVAAKESFDPDEPLPAFTLPVIDEAEKAALLRSVEEARAAAAQAPSAAPPPAQAVTAGDPMNAEPTVMDGAATEATEMAPPAPFAGAPFAEALPAPNATRFAALAATAQTAWARTLATLKHVWSRALVHARRGVDAACAGIDQGRERLPPRVRTAIRDVPSGVLLGVLLTLTIGMFGGGIALGLGLRGDDPEPAPAAVVPVVKPVVDPVPRELEQAKKDGHASIELLAAKYPKDARVGLALAASHAKKGDHAAAVAAVKKTLSATLAAREQPLARDVLAAAVRKRDTAEAALALLQGPMGAAGATVMYDLSIDPKVSMPFRARAEQWVRSEAFGKVATPEVGLAADLRYAKSCSQRHALLPDAAEKGEQRVLDFLHVATSKTGCGRRASKDCYPCLRKDEALKVAIASIEKRLAAK